MQTGRYHHIFDLSVCNERISESAYVESFLREMVPAIGMTILAGPIMAEGIPENPGITGLVAVDFSHISVHTFTGPRETLIDIFSCKPYDREVAEEVCMKFFATPETEVRHKEVFWG